MSTQRRASFIAQNVRPGAQTTMQIPGDREGPRQGGGEIYYYSLSPLSTVPFVGFNASDKIISWGESFPVFPGENVTIINKSFHPGDIVLQTGFHPAPHPAAIHVPMSRRVVGAPPWFQAFYPADVRRARRAFVTFLGATLAYPITVSVFGQNIFHSSFADGAMITNNYTKNVTIPANSPLGTISLGADDGSVTLPGALLDTATVTIPDIAQADLGIITRMFYTIEY